MCQGYCNALSVEPHFRLASAVAETHPEPKRAAGKPLGKLEESDIFRNPTPCRYSAMARRLCSSLVQALLPQMLDGRQVWVSNANPANHFNNLLPSYWMIKLWRGSTVKFTKWRARFVKYANTRLSDVGTLATAPFCYFLCKANLFELMLQHSTLFSSNYSNSSKFSVWSGVIDDCDCSIISVVGTCVLQIFAILAKQICNQNLSKDGKDCWWNRIGTMAALWELSSKVSTCHQHLQAWAKLPWWWCLFCLWL